MLDEIFETENLAEPEKPTESCEICGATFEYTRTNYSGLSGRLPRSPLLYWLKVYHPECEKTRAERREEELARHREEMKAKRISDWSAELRSSADRWYESARLPVDARLKTFDLTDADPENREVVALLQKWRPTDDFGILLMGPAGTGKSHLGFAMIEQLIRDHIATPAPQEVIEYDAWVPSRGKLPVYYSVAELLAQIKTAEHFEIPAHVLDGRILFLDDLGSENITEWSREIFFRIFEHRLNRKLPVIVTSNLTLNELKDRMHERVVSRILGLCIPISLKGRDRRRDALSNRLQELRNRA